MIVGFMVLDGGLGGHARSARSIRRALMARGFTVELALSDRSTPLFDAASLEHAYVPRERPRSLLFDRRQLPALTQWIERRHINVLHAFDPRSGLLGYWIARAKGVPLLTTMCGGTARFRYPPTRPVVVFSQELKDSLVHRYGYPAHEVYVEAGRMDLSEQTSPLERGEIRAALGIDPDATVCLHVSRIDADRSTVVAFVLEAVARCAATDKSLVYCLIGRGQDPLSVVRIETLMSRINAAHQREVCIWDRGRFVLEASRSLPAADVCIGVGRSCYEAMLANLPVLVVSKYGYAGPAIGEQGAPDPELLYFNMSGRNARGQDRERSIDALVADLLPLLADKEGRMHLGTSGRAWVARALSADRSAGLYSELYRQLLRPGFRQHRDSALATIPAYLRLTASDVRAWLRTIAGGWLRRRAAR